MQRCFDMDATYHKPKLRWPLDIRMHDAPTASGDAGTRAESQRVVVLQCPLGVTPQPLVLISAVAPVLALFQGELTTQEILARCAPSGLGEETLRELITLLDDNLFLANARFFAAERSMKENFLNLSVRPAALAGLSYPESREALRKLVDGYLVDLQKTPSHMELCCLVAPHIDYQRGGVCYGGIYPHLAASNADLYILIGTSHQYSERLFHLSAKDFESPLGVLSCRTDFVSRVASRYGTLRAFADEFLHKREHSLELQLPFMSRVRPQASIAPILVGSFHKAIASGRYPHEWEEYEAFVASLVEAIQAENREGKRVCFVAGVDMAHIGPFFGDDWTLSPQKMTLVAERDREYLKAIETRDLRKLFAHVAEDGDARRICGFPTMYTILDVLERLGVAYSSHSTSYEQAVDYISGCAVTFAGMALYEPSSVSGTGGIAVVDGVLDGSSG
jgi:AmmeMemoRadiSam system protein B